MKKILLFVFASFLLTACAGSAPEVSKTPANEKGETPFSEKEKETVAAHSTDKEKEAEMADASAPEKTGKPDKRVERSNEKTKWSRSGNPIDTSRFDKAIARAKTALEEDPEDSVAKKVLAEAYYDRAFALTKAAQYAAAVGDYRKTLRYDPDHDEAKKEIEQILMIYKSMNREAPKEGEEPEPLKLAKGKN